MAHYKNCVTKLGNFVANSIYNEIEAEVVSSFVKRRKTNLPDSEESMFASKGI